ncbi:GntR family transcriptional regulator [Heliobacterium undosum]|uniref:GntR family transcriptional regulator n=1 Tax=Heliomicrobium undosum TaxID=121734 RepID=A0A845KYZ1_9FIRM|nr:GntR family transcriptional regulator [Heliomicrobium undosum]MZP29212.1 GntR family transcriptional regulator [Heliomicrobium undosum]
MWYDVDLRSPVPVFQQLFDGIKAAVAKGILAPGDRLPSVRELAAQIMLNPNTIAKAYQALERDRVIETLRGRGTFVAGRHTRRAVTDAEKQQVVEAHIHRLLVEAHYLDMDEEECLQRIAAAVRQWHRSRTDR